MRAHKCTQATYIPPGPNFLVKSTLRKTPERKEKQYIDFLESYLRFFVVSGSPSTASLGVQSGRPLLRKVFKLRQKQSTLMRVMDSMCSVN